MLDKVIFAKGMSFLSIALDAKLDDAKLEVYYAVLKNMSNDAFERSIENVLSNRKYKGLPTPAEILLHDDTKDKLVSNVAKQAKQMYEKFYSECCAMLDYCTKNRTKIASDRKFFLDCDYKNLSRVDGTKTYTKQELYVLETLGGGEWLLNIRFFQNSNEVIQEIERVISQAIKTKYLNNRVRLALGGTK